MTDPKRPDDAEELETADVDAAAVDASATADADADADAEMISAADDSAELDADDTADAADDDLTDGYEQEPVAVAGEPVLAADDAAPTRPMSSRERRAAREAGQTKPVAGPDDLPYVDDRVSKWWVGLIALTFLLIIAYGFLFGRGGFLTPVPTPVPSEPAVIDSPTPGASTSAAPSITIVPSRSPAASGSPGASSSPASSGSPPASSASPASSAAPSGTPAT
jgi:hypothetical protein